MNKQIEELNAYLKENRIKQSELADALGIARPTMSNILSGRYKMSNENASKIADFLGLNEFFLLTGKGELVTHSAPDEQEKQKDIPLKSDSLEIVRLRAENTQLRNECEWLRSMVQGLSLATQN